MSNQRDTFVFYRSFKECMQDLPDSDKLLMYEAISDYSLDMKEPELSGFPKALFTLIRPILDSNNQRWINGSKGGAPKGNKNNRYSKSTTKVQPKYNQSTTKIQANKDKEEESNYKESPNGDKKETSVSSPGNSDFIKFQDWMKSKAPYCSNPKNFSSQITESEFLKLKEKYTGKEVADIIEQIENRKDLRKRYTNLYRTVLNWAKKEYGK